MEAAGAHMHVPRGDPDYGLEVGVRMLTLRRIIKEKDGAYVFLPGGKELATYYANAISHLEGAPEATL